MYPPGFYPRGDYPDWEEYQDYRQKPSIKFSRNEKILITSIWTFILSMFVWMPFVLIWLCELEYTILTFLGCEILVLLGLTVLTCGLFVLGYIACGAFLFIFYSVVIVTGIWEGIKKVGE